ncbi:putative homeobox-leucine zipper protein ROC8-like [Capsicum annuum]|nr:putative homeobox-leucine zipper protein ROC8-like [Capsicum annuum]
MIDATTGYEAMSFMDGSSGYNQILMSPKDEELTAFHTPKGIYYYKVMPFGLKNVGATYKRAMQNIFDGLLHKNVERYADDLVVKSRKRYDHLKDLRMVFELLQRYQLRMNPLKCAFGVTSRKFLGFIVRHRGIKIDQAKRSVGAVLAQENSEGKEKSLYYLSRTMTPNKLKYSPIEKLCLALAFSIQKMKHYFQAHVVRLVSRAIPIKFVMSKPVLNVVGPLPKSSGGHLYILAATDYFSKWAEVIALKEVKKKIIVNFIRVNIVYRFGISQYIITDNGKPFDNKLMNKICDLFGFKQHKSSMYHAAANGLAEAFNKTLCNLLNKVISKSKRDWHERMEEALWAYRKNYRTPTQATPYSLGFRVEAALPLERQIPSLRLAIQEGLTDEKNTKLRLVVLEAFDEKRLEAQQNLEYYQARLFRSFNKRGLRWREGWPHQRQVLEEVLSLKEDVHSLSCGSCGYELNLNSSSRNTASIGSKYGKSIKKGMISFLSIDESRFTQVDEFKCVPFFFSKRSWGLFQRRTKLQCRKCGNDIGIAYDDSASSYPLVADASDTASGSEITTHRKYDIKIRSLQPSSSVSGTPLPE